MTMAEHPAEPELLALVEGELSRSEGRSLEAHLTTCAVCRRAVAAQRDARALLRGAPAIPPLAPQHVRDLVRALPAHPRPTSWWGRRSAPRPALVWRLKPVFVLAPVGAAAVAVVLAVSLSGGSGPAPAPEVLGTPAVGALPKVAPAAVAAAGTRTAAAATVLTQADASPVLDRVGGPAAQVVAFLEARGIVARVEGGRVIVRKADGQRARRALASRRDGPVQVVAR